MNIFKMTAEEIIEYFTTKEWEVENLAYLEDYDLAREQLINDLGKIECCIYSTGGENAGSNWSVVHYFVDHNIYLRIDGYYQSHYGCTFDDWDTAVYEVRPQEKTITVYE